MLASISKRELSQKLQHQGKVTRKILTKANFTALRAKQDKNVDAFYTQALEQIQKPVKTRNVPSVALMSDSKERLYQAAITLQRVIHGRAMQMQIHQGRDIWKEMMEEIKSTDTVSASQREHLLLLKEHMYQNARVTNMMEHIVGTNVGSTIGDTLSLLATELLRFKNISIAHDQALLAECARWNREMLEAGRRQKEAIRRKEHNLMFAQLLEVYQESINELLEGLVSKAREHEAKVQALEYAKEMALLAELARAAELEAEEEPVSADLLLEFIAPEGLRELTRTCMLILKQKYTEARQELVRGGRAEPLDEDTDERSPETDEISPPAQESSYLETQPTELTTSALDRTSSTHSYRTSDTNHSPPPERETEARTSVGTAETEVRTSVGTAEMSYKSRADTSSADVTITVTGADTEMGTTLPYEQTQSEKTTTVLVDSSDTVIQPPARFGLAVPAGAPPEERLLSRIMRDMCYVAGYLLHTAAKIINKALQLSSIPRESFEEALRRTMQVINGAREEIARLILPTRKPPPFILPSNIASEEIITEATKIVDDIISKAKERIQEVRDASNRTVPDTTVETEIRSQAKQLIEDIIKDAQKKVIQAVAEDFLTDLLKDAQTKVDYVTGDCVPPTTVRCEPPTTVRCEPLTTVRCDPPTTVRCEPPTTVRREPPTTVHCEPPTTVRCEPPTTVRCEPPTTVHCEPPTTVRCEPPTSVPCSMLLIPTGLVFKT
ncbi:Cilia- and flagella-associated protein 91 [Homalodisca vitripennis]|nr:Cilia- and flagella-associated protein 91 [Homalodisca vitripennis]